MGRCYQKLGNDDDARNAYVKALRLNPRSVQPSLELAQLYFDENRGRLAWDYYQQYVQRTGRQSARALWLGIQLSNSLGYRNQQSSYELALDNLYRRSGEYRQWQEWKAEQERSAAMSDDMVVLPGERCRKAREAQGMTQAQAAQRLHLSLTYLQSLDADDYERLPEATFVKAICAITRAFSGCRRMKSPILSSRWLTTMCWTSRCNCRPLRRRLRPGASRC